MKALQKTILVNVSNEIKVGSLELTTIHQIIIYQDKEGKAQCSVEDVEYTDITFMGLAIGDSYKEYSQFRETLKGMGIDLNKIIDGEVGKMNFDKIKEEYLEKAKLIFE